MEALIQLPRRRENNKEHNREGFQQIFDLINNLKNIGFIRREELLLLMAKSTAILENQPTLLNVVSPITIVGDIHGQFYDLLGLFEMFGYPPATSYLFLGDYVDRGKFSIEVITLLLQLKVAFPNSIHLLRGNHEGRAMTTLFSFKYECQKKYNNRIYQKFLQLFTKLPLCALIDNKYIAVHAGISPKLRTIGDIRQVFRFSEIDQSEPFFDLLWSDPSNTNSNSWTFNTDRNCSYFYSPSQAHQFLKNNQLELIIRGHEVASKGFKYQYSRQQVPLSLTIFSAPNYCGNYGNQASVAQIRNGQINIKNFRERREPLVLSSYSGVFQLTLPLISTSVTKIFKFLFKKSYTKEMRKRSASQKLEDAHIILALQKIQNDFSKNSREIIGFLESMSKDLEQKNNDHPIKSAEELMIQILQMKLSDQGERFPKNFGPSNIQFVNFQSMHRRMLVFEDDLNESNDHE